MLKNLSTIELKIGDRIYKFLCEMDSPIGEVYDVLNKMKEFVIQKINEAQEAEKKPPGEGCCPKEE